MPCSGRVTVISEHYKLFEKLVEKFSVSLQKSKLETSLLFVKYPFLIRSRPSTLKDKVDLLIGKQYLKLVLISFKKYQENLGTAQKSPSIGFSDVLNHKVIEGFVFFRQRHVS